MITRIGGWDSNRLLFYQIIVANIILNLMKGRKCIMSNSEVKINDLLEKTNIEDGNLIIVEDEEDTKKSTIHRLKNNFLGDNYEPDGYRFYSSKKVEE